MLPSSEPSVSRYLSVGGGPCPEFGETQRVWRGRTGPASRWEAFPWRRGSCSGVSGTHWSRVITSDTLQCDGGCCLWVIHHSRPPPWRVGGRRVTDGKQVLGTAQRGMAHCSMRRAGHSVTGPTSLFSFVLKKQKQKTINFLNRQDKPQKG